MSRRRTAAAFMLAAIAAGLVVRLVALGLPSALVKYGGSALYAVMLFWLLAALAPRTRSIWLALAAACLVTAIECFKRVHSPGLDAFRLTLAGKLLLGRIFAWRDLLAYYLAIALVALLHRPDTPS